MRYRSHRRSLSMGHCLQLTMFPISFSPASENIHFRFYLSTFRKKRGFCVLHSSEKQFGNQLFLDSRLLVDFSTFHSYRLVRVQKVSDRFPDERVSIAQLYPDIHTLFSDARLGLQCIVPPIQHSAVLFSLGSPLSSLTFDYLEFTGASTFTMHTYRRG